MLLASTPWAANRAAADELLERTLAWAGDNAVPERVFDAAKLHAWAAKQGYARTVDVEQIAAVLRKVQPWIVAPSELATEVNDLIAQYS